MRPHSFIFIALTVVLSGVTALPIDDDVRKAGMDTSNDSLHDPAAAPLMAEFPAVMDAQVDIVITENGTAGIKNPDSASFSRSATLRSSCGAAQPRGQARSTRGGTKLAFRADYRL